MYQIRPALLEDVHTIARVHVSAWQTAYQSILASSYLDGLSVIRRAERWSEILEKRDQVTFVAEVDGRGVIGFVNGGPEREGRGDYEGEIYALYLLAEFRAQGIGRELFHQAVAAFLDRAMGSMLVWVLARNPYRGFYEAMGGEVGDRKWIEIDGQPLEEVAYVWHDLGTLH